MHRKHGAYSLFRKQTKKGEVWYARFWDRSEGRYSLVRSTGIVARGKKGRRQAADDAAREMLGEVIFNPSLKPFTRYVEDFWEPDSVYVRECALVDKKPLSLSYIKMNHGIAVNHVTPYPGFKGLYLPDLSSGLIHDWMLWEAERGVSGIRINKALQAMRIPVRYALSRDELRRDPFKNVKDAAATREEKGILTKQEVRKLLELQKPPEKEHLAVLLGVLCGMRLGEVRGLHWEDIDGDTIHIRHNWQDLEGIKTPKCGSERTVPLPEAVKKLVRTVPREGALVYGRPDGKPLCNGYFRNSCIRELKAIGIDKDAGKDRRLSFHSLRHTYVTLGRMAGITDIEIQVLAGHKSFAMTEHYSHVAQVIDYGEAKEKFETVLRDKKRAKITKKT